MRTNAFNPPAGLRRAASLALLAVVALGLLGWRLDRDSLLGDEALYASVALDTRDAGRWLPMEVDGDQYLQKPIGGFALLRASFSTLGIDEVSDRIPSVVCGWLAVLVLGWAAGRWLGPGCGLFAGLLYVASGRVLAFHGFRSGVFEGPLMLCLNVALCAWIESLRRPRSRAFGVTLGATAGSVLFKNLAGPGLAAPAVFLGELFAVREPWLRRLRRALGRTILVLAVGAAVYAGWLWVLHASGAKAVVDHLWMRDVLRRSAGTLVPRQRADPDFYVRLMGGDFGPALVLLAAAAVGLALAMRRGEAAESPRRALFAGALAWAIGPTLAVSLFGSKLPWYDLAAYAGIALAAACGLSELAHWVPPERRALVGVLGVVLAAVTLARGVERVAFVETGRVPLQDVPRALERFPAARLYIPPDLHFRDRLQRHALRAQSYFYVRMLRAGATVGWPAGNADATCPVLFLVRRGMDEVPDDLGRWSRLEFPSILDIDAAPYLLLDRCQGRFLRLIGGTADQRPAEPLSGRPGHRRRRRAGSDTTPASLESDLSP